MNKSSYFTIARRVNTEMGNSLLRVNRTKRAMYFYERVGNPVSFELASTLLHLHPSVKSLCEKLKHLSRPTGFGRVYLTQNNPLLREKALLFADTIPELERDFSSEKHDEIGLTCLEHGHLDYALARFLYSGNAEYCLLCAHEYLKAGRFFDSRWVFEYLQAPVNQLREAFALSSMIAKGDYEEALEVCTFTKNGNALNHLIEHCTKDGYSSIVERAFHILHLFFTKNYSFEKALDLAVPNGTTVSMRDCTKRLSDLCTNNLFYEPKRDVPIFEQALSHLLVTDNHVLLSDFADTCNLFGHVSIAWRALFANELTRWKRENAHNYCWQPTLREFDLQSAYEQPMCDLESCETCKACG